MNIKTHLLFRAMGDKIRLALLERIIQADGTLTVNQLLECVNEQLGTHIQQPTLSHHLHCLRKAGLVEVQRHGPHHYYTCNLIALEACHQHIEQLKTA